MFESFQKLEKDLDVENIRVNGIQVWPILRIYLADQLVFQKDTRVKLNQNVYLGAIRFLFYGIGGVFRKWENLFFSSSDQRKKVGDVLMDRADILAEFIPGTNIVELPSGSKHYSRRNIPKGSPLMSKFPFYISTWLMAKLKSNVQIEGEEIIEKFLNEFKLKLNYQWQLKLFFAQRSLMKKLIHLKGIKQLMMITPYTNMGYVFACKEKGLRVIEFQHGSINKSHFAYNINKAFDRRFYPDMLLTFGLKELQTFDTDNHYIEADQIHPVGSFIIDHLVRNGVEDEAFSKMTARYQTVVAYAAQDAMEDLYIEPLKELARKLNGVAFVLMTRHRTPEYYEQFDFPDNILFAPWLTTYEVICLSDFHSTINSTTAAEAPSLGTVNILLDVDGRARSYWSSLDSGVCLFAENAEEFQAHIKSKAGYDRQSVMRKNEQIIVPGFYENVKKLLPTLTNYSK